MKVLVDMNLSPIWAEVLRDAGFEAAHWSALGEPGAQDRVIFDFARSGAWVILTHDLDFGTLLAHTQTRSPSVVQVRTQDLAPEALGGLLIRVLKSFQRDLEAGALVTVDEARQRVRVLPLG